jgi:hypothetical protein
VKRSGTLERRTPLKAKRATPRRTLLPRCKVGRCKQIARIDGWCIPHAEHEADRRFSLWVRARDGRCTAAEVLTDRPCEGRLQAAHIEGRAKKSTRYDPDNVWTLCERHHRIVDQHAMHAAKARWAVAVLGVDGYHELIERAATTTDRTTAIERALDWLPDPKEA